MGTSAHVVLFGGRAPTTDQVVAQLDAFESAWSRFRPGAELSLLSAGTGSPTKVSHPTAVLIESAVWAWHRTGGLFDPTVLHAVGAAGYDRPFSEMGRGDAAPALADHASRAARPTPTPGCDGIEVDLRTDTVRLPSGVGIDPGGIGKGLAADLAATAAVADGADAALVSIGGDLRVAGAPPPDGCEIELDHHIAPIARVNLLSGAVATSSTLRRRWQTRTGTAHHVIDPRSGRSSTGPLVACSVITGDAWWAEALATALLVGWGEHPGDERLRELLEDAGALLTFADGAQIVVGTYAASFSFGWDR